MKKHRMHISLAAAAVLLTGSIALAPAARASEAGPEIEKIEWSFQGPLGTYDRNALRRGYKVYKEVCSTCHSMNLVKFRNLSDKGGPEFSVSQVKAMAAEIKVQDGPDSSGEMFERPGEPKDTFPAPYPNEEAAAATLGAAPPDLSLIAKAREGGPDYLHTLLTGYNHQAPAGFVLPPSGHYNPYFVAGSGVIAMPPPLTDGQVDYEDGTPNTVEQMSKDVATLLMWTAEPKLEQRHYLGFMVMIYLIALAGLLFFATRKVWSGQH